MIWTNVTREPEFSESGEDSIEVTSPLGAVDGCCVEQSVSPNDETMLSPEQLWLQYSKEQFEKSNLPSDK